MNDEIMQRLDKIEERQKETEVKQEKTDNQVNKIYVALFGVDNNGGLYQTVNKVEELQEVFTKNMYKLIGGLIGLQLIPVIGIIIQFLNKAA